MKVCIKCRVEKENFRERSGRKINTCKECEKLDSVEYRKKTSKLCNKCNEEKPLKYFGIHIISNGVDRSSQKKRYRKSYNTFCIDCGESETPWSKEKQSEYNKEYRLKNKEAKAIIDKIYNTKPEVIARRKELRNINKEIINKVVSEWRKEKMKNDPIYALNVKVRRSIARAFKSKGVKKNTKTENILGCDFETFKIYIESQFESWMSWENRGLYNGELNYGWDLDHKEPLSNAETETDIMRLNHYTNFQPLCSYTNRYIKRNTFTKHTCGK